MRENRKQSRSGIALTWLFAGMIVLMMCLIGTRLVTSKLLVQRLGVENEWTDFVLGWSDLRSLPRKEQEKDKEAEVEYVDIDWATLYPFEESEEEPELPEQSRLQEALSIAERLKEKVVFIENIVKTYATDRLPGYYQMSEASYWYEDAIKWNFVSYNEYNGIIELEENYYVGLIGKQDLSECAESVISFADFCRENGSDFLFIETPGKISKYEDTEISGTLDFSNQNADDFLAKLTDAGISVFDLRESIRQSGKAHHSFFYQTDHHWKAETGLWASKLILGRLSEEFGVETHPNILSLESFDAAVYPNWFLGTQGKKATLAQAVPEDITLFYPKADSNLHYVIPDLGIDIIGDFSITYDMDAINEIDYYGKSPYAAYNHLDHPVIEIENGLISNDKRVLIIHDSYFDCVIPFLSLDIKNIDSLDLRHFTGSVEKYVEEKKPDIVIVSYNCTCESTIDWTTHKSEFDFR